LRLRPFLQTRRGLDGRWSAGRLDGKRLRTDVAAMAGATGDRHAGARDPDDVVGIDLFSHGVHEARNFLQCLGILCQCGARWTVCCDDAGVFRVAGAASNSQLTVPLFHDVVDLLPGQVFGKHLEVCGAG